MCAIITRRLLFGLVFVFCHLYPADQVFESVPLLRTSKGTIFENGYQKRLDISRSADRKSVVLKETRLHKDGDWTVSEVPLLTLKTGTVQGVNASTEFPGATYEDSFTVKIFVDGRLKTIKASVNDVLKVFKGKEKVRWSGDYLIDSDVFDKSRKPKTTKELNMLDGIQESEYSERSMRSLFGGYTVGALEDDKGSKKPKQTSKIFMLFCCLVSVIALQQSSPI